MSKWFYRSAGEVHGPFSIDEMKYLARRGQLKPRDKVRLGDDGRWQAAHQIPGLIARRSTSAPNEGAPVTPVRPKAVPLSGNASLQAAEPPAQVSETPVPVAPGPAPPPVAPPTPPSQNFQAVPTRRPDDGRKKLLIASTVAAACLLLVAFLFLFFILTSSSGGAGAGESSMAGTGATGNGAQQGQAGQPDGSGTTGTPPPGDSSDSDTAATAAQGNGPPPDPDLVAVDSTSTQSALNDAAQDDSSRSAFTIGGSEFFGVTATGDRFVYIIDCSGSMDGPRFDKARTELLRSLFALEDDKEFSVIFFSDEAYPMFGSASLLTASQNNKARVERWVDNFQIQGGTNPEDAVRLALGERPDAIFLLTDGDFDGNSVATARNLNTRDVTINTIGFEDRAGESRLKTIASDSGGKYRFVP